MDLKKIKQLTDFVLQSGVTEIEIEEEGKEGKVKIRVNNSKAVQIAASPLIQAPAHISEALPQHGDPQEKAESQKQTANVAKHTVNSPMVGTVYFSASPGAKHFVEIGQQVKIGDTLCLIEAMKMFNRIEADKNGVVSAKLVENGQPVEYGQQLFVIE
jgi:acetyl-CoA carboxylase biotin carboxyl carrier protein